MQNQDEPMQSQPEPMQNLAKPMQMLAFFSQSVPKALCTDLRASWGLAGPLAPLGGSWPPAASAACDACWACAACVDPSVCLEL